MTFTPVVPTGGLVGWRFLERTRERQMSSLASTPATQRAETDFRTRIGRIGSAAELVADRGLLSVALTAFGLSEDLPNRAFIQRVLDSDPSDRRSFANRLADKRYADLARAFGFASETGNRLRDPAEVEAVLGRARALRFEAAVGEQDNGLRLALALQRDLGRIAAQAGSDLAGWYTVLGTPNLREVFETAFGLPREFAGLDLDRQVNVLRERTRRLTGSSEITQFTQPDTLEKLTRRYLVGAQMTQIQQVDPRSNALALLQATPALSWRRQ